MNNEVVLRPVSKDEYGEVRKLAETIWPVCYKDILSAEQIEYMMDMMYSADVIAREIAEGICYCFVESGGRIAGYLSWGPWDAVTMSAKLHKLYLLPELHCKGIGSRAIEMVKQQLEAAGFCRLLLNVNRQNSKAIKCYERNGFSIIKQENNDIGNGFFMNDFVMETVI